VAVLSAPADLLPAPTAGRLRRPSWRDPRLVVGIVLVLASVALGARVVAAADDTVPVWAAAGALAPGTALTKDRVTIARVRIEGDSAARYLSAVTGPPDVVVLRTVGPGEIIPASAVGPASSLQQRPVVIPVAQPLPVGLAVGAAADIWVSRKDTTTGAAVGAYAKPERIVQGAPVRAITRSGGTLGASSAAGVEVMLDTVQLPAVLDALANEAQVALVPVPGSAPAGGKG